MIPQEEFNSFKEIAKTVASQTELLEICSKVLKVVAEVLVVERASLFVISTDSLGNRKLVSQLFDVTPDSEVSNEFSKLSIQNVQDGESIEIRAKITSIGSASDECNDSLEEKIESRCLRSVSINGENKVVLDASQQTQAQHSNSVLEIPLDDSSVLGKVALREIFFCQEVVKKSRLGLQKVAFRRFTT